MPHAIMGIALMEENLIVVPQIEAGKILIVVRWLIQCVMEEHWPYSYYVVTAEALSGTTKKAAGCF
ncbi:hypothetical protein RRH01S_12_00920 [Rhizobium rhizogenes NBRC 13257]|uniref:Uncharacterized protein n=1 Tax=Rhizobium rhizogenes NBRC 13257 TaxID=1220581 RepID=A0AA87Q4T8_RHIRH|nr:hypothetical protein RRH01S_12_00920 [Rhizobium rhizogenes NBRC 13257]